MAEFPFPPVPERLQGLTDRQQRELALRLAAPMRANAGATLSRQHDASGLPLFTSANEPRLL